MDAKNISSNRKRTLRKSLLNLLTWSTLAITACAPGGGGGGGSGGGSGGGGGGGNPPGGNPNPAQNHGTYGIPASQVNNYSNGTITLSSQINNLKIGDIVGFGIIPGIAPYGALREVTGMSFDKKQIFTTQSVIEEALGSETIRYNEFSSQDIIPQENLASPLAMEMSEEFDEEVVDGVNLSGNLSFVKKNNLEFISSNGNLTGFKVAIQGNLSSSVKVDALTSSTDMDYTLNFPPQYFPPIIVGYIPTPSGIPIPIIVVAKCDAAARLGGDVSPISTGVSQEAEFTVGLIYQNGDWSAQHTFENDFDHVSPTLPTYAVFKASISPRCGLLFYGISGPYVEMETSAQLIATNQSWSLEGRLKTSIGVDVDLISRKLSDYFKTQIDDSKILDFGTISPPQQTTVTLPPSQDAYVWESNLGADSGFNNGELLLEKDGIRTQKNALMQFPSLPSGANVTSAKLNLYGYCLVNVGNSIEVNSNGLIESWNESTVKWSTKPTYNSAISSSSEVPYGGVSTWKELDLTSIVQSQTNSGVNNGIAFSLGDNESRCFFTSSEYSDLSLRPNMVVKYTQ